MVKTKDDGSHARVNVVWLNGMHCIMIATVQDEVFGFDAFWVCARFVMLGRTEQGGR